MWHSQTTQNQARWNGQWQSQSDLPQPPRPALNRMKKALDRPQSQFWEPAPWGGFLPRTDSNCPE